MVRFISMAKAGLSLRSVRQQIGEGVSTLLFFSPPNKLLQYDWSQTTEAGLQKRAADLPMPGLLECHEMLKNTSLEHSDWEDISIKEKKTMTYMCMCLWACACRIIVKDKWILPGQYCTNLRIVYISNILGFPKLFFWEIVPMSVYFSNMGINCCHFGDSNEITQKLCPNLFQFSLGTDNQLRLMNK